MRTINCDICGAMDKPDRPVYAFILEIRRTNQHTAPDSGTKNLDLCIPCMNRVKERLMKVHLPDGVQRDVLTGKFIPASPGEGHTRVDTAPPPAEPDMLLEKRADGKYYQVEVRLHDAPPVGSLPETVVQHDDPGPTKAD